MRKSIIKIGALVFTAILTFGSVNAQDERNVDFSLYLGTSVPAGSFGNGTISADNQPNVAWNPLLSNITDGGAGVGFNVGFKAKFDIPQIEGLGFIATADFFWNGLTNEIRNWQANYVENLLANQPSMPNYNNKYISSGNSNGYEASYDVKLALPNHINIPIMGGLNYEYDFSDEVDLWAEFGVGVNIGMLTDIVLETTWRSNYDNSVGDFKGDNSYEYKSQNKIEFNVKPAFAFQLGAGIKVLDKISIGFHYYSLGNRELIGKYYQGGEVDKSSVNYVDDNKTIKTSIVSIRLGYHF